MEDSRIIYNVSDISIVILKNLIFNDNEIKAGRILTFFPTKTIQVGKVNPFYYFEFLNFGKHAYKLNVEKRHYLRGNVTSFRFYIKYFLCRSRGCLANYW